VNNTVWAISWMQRVPEGEPPENLTVWLGR
jgi:hypothetical protein